jgi:hypothetical protein
MAKRDETRTLLLRNADDFDRIAERIATAGDVPERAGMSAPAGE